MEKPALVISRNMSTENNSAHNESIVNLGFENRTFEPTTEFAKSANFSSAIYDDAEIGRAHV